MGYKYHVYNTKTCYYCHGCYQKVQKKENFVNLRRNENGEKYLTAAAANQKHYCKPVKFDLVTVEKNIINLGNYIFAEVKNDQNVKSKQLIVFTSEAKDFCYTYLYITRNELFKCKACLRMGKNSSAKICNNLDGEECIRLGVVKHVCKPVKYSTIKTSITKFLEYNDFPKNPKLEKKKLEEKMTQSDLKIIKLPNFKLLPNQNGIKDSIINISYKNDKTLFYQYSYQTSTDSYVCLNCQRTYNITVSAKLCRDNNGIQYITLGNNEHVCQPMKEVEKEKFTNYLMFDRDDETKPTKLVVFTSPERISCYEYFQPKGRIKFSCRKCIKLRVSKCAKVVKDEDGTEYIEFDEREHLCEPFLFNRSKYEENPTIPKSHFFLFPNSKGTPNKRLIIFDPNDYNLGYDCNKRDSYICYTCEINGHAFTTKLSTTKNGENCLEILQNGHVCEPKNLFKEKRIYYLPNYKIDNDENGNQMIILKHPMDKKLCYKFEYDNDLDAFCCIQCRKEKNRITAAKICKTNTNEEVVVLAYSHYCEPFRH